MISHACYYGVLCNYQLCTSIDVRQPDHFASSLNVSSFSATMDSINVGVCFSFGNSSFSILYTSVDGMKAVVCGFRDCSRHLSSRMMALDIAVSVLPPIRSQSPFMLLLYSGMYCCTAFSTSLLDAYCFVDARKWHKYHISKQGFDVII